MDQICVGFFVFQSSILVKANTTKEMTMDKIHLIHKKMTGTLLPNEEKKLQMWLRDNPQNQKQMERIEAAWDAIDVAEAQSIDIDSKWMAFQNRIASQEELVKHLSRTQNRFIEYLFPVHSRFRFSGLAVAVVLIVSALVWFVQQHMFSPDEWRAAYGEQISTYLPDGSLFWLNSGSILKWEQCDDVRLVTLVGEAFFDVEKADVPFVVKTENASIRVVGTRFNVWAREETRISVQQGIVELESYLKNVQKKMLLIGQLGVVDASGQMMPVANVDINHYFGWIEGKLVFEKMPIPEVIAELERHFNVSIDLQNPALQERTLTATFNQLPVQSVLKSICVMLDAVCYQDTEKDYRIQNCLN